MKPGLYRVKMDIVGTGHLDKGTIIKLTDLRYIMSKREFNVTIKLIADNWTFEVGFASVEAIKSVLEPLGPAGEALYAKRPNK